MKLQGLSQNTGGQKVIILFNLLLRFGQLVTGVVTIILYSQENGYWLNKGIPGKIRYEFAVGALAILTAIALGLIPLMLSYRPVAFAAPWDMIMFFLYSAAVKFSPSKAK
ncbi:hypothetical protein LTR41_000570 [Exophiala xenobiotica]|nr:hypothetical protein LTR41_000570 [Exophiala xenobiotica]KAK5418135.1 hypothetical protein LTR06_001884 [Exophiala xenobiotica]